MATTEITSLFTAGETKLLVSIMKHMTGNPPVNPPGPYLPPPITNQPWNQTDWDAVAQDQGYKDASIARTRYGQIRKKKLDGAGNGAPEGGVDKASPGGRKAAGKPKKAGGDGGKVRGKGKKVKEEEVGGEGEDEGEDRDGEGQGEKVKMEMDD